MSPMAQAIHRVIVRDLLVRTVVILVMLVNTLLTNGGYLD